MNKPHALGLFKPPSWSDCAHAAICEDMEY